MCIHGYKHGETGLNITDLSSSIKATISILQRRHKMPIGLVSGSNQIWESVSKYFLIMLIYDFRSIFSQNVTNSRCLFNLRNILILIWWSLTFCRRLLNTYWWWVAMFTPGTMGAWFRSTTLVASDTQRSFHFSSQLGQTPTPVIHGVTHLYMKQRSRERSTFASCYCSMEQIQIWGVHLNYARVYLLRICIIFYDFFLFIFFCRNSEGKSALDVASESSGGTSQRGDTSYAVQRSSGDNLEPPAATRQVLTGMQP